jgi:hypothetical protein
LTSDQDRHRRGTQHDCEHEHLHRRQRAGCQRPVRGAHHHAIDALIDQMIDCRGRGRRQPDADRAGDQRPQRHHARHREEHADDRGEHDQRDDARFGQFEVLVGDGGHCCA